MGFGLLLVGYMFSFLIFFGEYKFAGLLVGSIFMFWGLKELKKYSPVFNYAFIGNILLFVCSLSGAAIWIIDSFSGISLDIAANVYQFIKLGIALYFEITLLYGIADISRRVDYPDTRQKAFRNMVYVGVFNVCQIASHIVALALQGKTLDNSDMATVTFIMMIAQIVYTAINSFLIFKCYAMICPVGQENMPRKKSKFAFVNRFREIRDAKEDKAIEEMKNYYEDKLKKRNSKKNHRKKKK